MRKYAINKTAALLRHLENQVKSAAGSADADAIHDLRVAIRRLSRCLRVFAQFYPNNSWKKVRRQLSDMLHLAGAVRDRDIALELLEKAGVSKRATVALKLGEQRRRGERRLLAAVKRWDRDDIAAKWRSKLNA